MRDLHAKKTRPAGKNRLKKQRKPINYRGFFKKLVRLVGGLLVVALVALTGYEIYGVVARTTFLRLERIEVSELKRLTREEVIGLAGVKPGDDLLSLRLRRIGEQLAKNPWVEKVRVRRYFPHVLAIEVTEREPVAVVNMGYLYYLDKNGEIFKPLNEGDRLDYPVLTGFTEEELGKDPAGSREMLKKARDLIAQLASRTSFRMEDVSEIHCDKGYGFTLFLANGGVPVKLGNDAFDEKLNRLARIYQDLQPQMANLIYIDLDYSDKIIVKKV
ncbi:MAG TPA: cell division protein FtsQ/DivIB [Geobacteraceae bacterium]|nr:cell division protein FtsQ/DivIB [Geobacteraceae bacterium]